MRVFSCGWCDAKCETSSALKRFCTAHCREQHRRETKRTKHARACKRCQSRFSCVDVHSRRRHCSDDCRNRDRDDARTRRNASEKRKACSRRHHLKTTFGLTVAQWDAIFEAQGGKCGCCEAVCACIRSPDKWHTDHDHATKVVRGILCQRCNTVLGKLGDTSATVIEMCARLIAYLEAQCPRT